MKESVLFYYMISKNKTIDLGNRIVRKEEPGTDPEDQKDWFVGNNINDKIYTGSLNEVKNKIKKDEASKLTPDGFKIWPT